MTSLSIEKFNPLKKELHDLVENCKKVVMSDGKTGYALIDESRKILKRKRCDVVRILTNERAISNAYSKAVIKLQNDLVGIIDPMETELENKQKAIDLELLIEKQKELLPERKRQLEDIGVKLADREILVMKDKEYNEFYQQKKAIYLEAKEAALKAEADRIEQEKRLEEARRQARIEAEAQAKREAEEAARKAEEEKQRAIEAERQRAEAERQRLIREQEEKERARIEAEAQAKREAEEAEHRRKEEEEKMEKQKKYTKFLADSGYTEETKDSFKVEWSGNTATLWKKAGSITL